MYHAVTERPMSKGQVIVFDKNHHNGVYERVMTAKQIENGENPTGEFADMIRKDLDKWLNIANRELSLEYVRKNEFPDYPSRMACLYTSENLQEAKNWTKYFNDIGRKCYSVVKIRVEGNCFSGDACNVFDGYDLEKARHYWRVDTQNDRPIIETIVDGRLTVEQIIEEY